MFPTQNAGKQSFPARPIRAEYRPWPIGDLLVTPGGGNEVIIQAQISAHEGRNIAWGWRGGGGDFESEWGFL